MYNANNKFIKLFRENNANNKFIKLFRENHDNTHSFQKAFEAASTQKTICDFENSFVASENIINDCKIFIEMFLSDDYIKILSINPLCPDEMSFIIAHITHLLEDLLITVKILRKKSALNRCQQAIRTFSTLLIQLLVQPQDKFNKDCNISTTYDGDSSPQKPLLSYILYELEDSFAFQNSLKFHMVFFILLYLSQTEKQYEGISKQLKEIVNNRKMGQISYSHAQEHLKDSLIKFEQQAYQFYVNNLSKLILLSDGFTRRERSNKQYISMDLVHLIIAYEDTILHYLLEEAIAQHFGNFFKRKFDKISYNVEACKYFLRFLGVVYRKHKTFNKTVELLPVDTIFTVLDTNCLVPPQQLNQVITLLKSNKITPEEHSKIIALFFKKIFWICRSIKNIQCEPSVHNKNIIIGNHIELLEELLKMLVNILTDKKFLFTYNVPMDNNCSKPLYIYWLLRLKDNFYFHNTLAFKIFFYIFCYLASAEQWNDIALACKDIVNSRYNSRKDFRTAQPNLLENLVRFATAGFLYHFDQYYHFDNDNKLIIDGFTRLHRKNGQYISGNLRNLIKWYLPPLNLLHISQQYFKMSTITPCEIMLLERFLTFTREYFFRDFESWHVFSQHRKKIQEFRKNNSDINLALTQNSSQSIQFFRIVLTGQQSWDQNQNTTSTKPII